MNDWLFQLEPSHKHCNFYICAFKVLVNFCLGKFPYPTLSDADVLEAVKAGSYLECPENCDKKVYNLMLDCWMLNPNDRPTFSALKTTVESFMYDLYPYLQPEL